MEWYDYLLPPLIGAIIGYVTNYIAIKMLFRPHKKYKLGKIPIPFTPGIIPKKRNEIANSIGKMVGQVLLDEETLREKIQSESLSDGIHKALETELDNLLEKDVNTIYELIPDQYKSQFNEIVESIKSQLDESLNNYFKSQGFSNVVKDFLTNQISTALETQMGEIINYDDLPEGLSRQLESLMDIDSSSPEMKEIISNQLDRLKKSKLKIGEIIPEEVFHNAIAGLEEKMPELFRNMMDNFLQSDLRDEAIELIRNAVVELVQDLTRFKRFIANMIQVEEILDEQLPKHFDKLTENIGKFFDKQRNMRKLRMIMWDFTDQISELTIGDVADIFIKSDHIILEADMSHSIKRISSRQSVRSFLVQLIMQFLKNLRTKNLQEIIDSYYGQGSQRLIDYLYEYSVDYFRNPDSQEKLLNVLKEQIDYYIYSHKWGKLSNVINLSPERKNQILIFLTNSIVNTASRKLPEILKAVNLEKVVVEKVNNYPVAEVENLLMVVIAKHLKWINIFGAILGALIGLLQILLRFLT